MRVCIISDQEHTTDLSIQLKQALKDHFIVKGYTVLDYALQPDTVSSCIGCFGCWIKNPGECVMNDLISDINRNCMNSDLVIYLSPIVFGGFSASVKNVLDRSLPNISPFFTTNKGLTTHKKRYDNYPVKIIIGYGNSIIDKEQDTFINWITTHSIGHKVYLCLSSKDKDNILSALKNISCNQEVI